MKAVISEERCLCFAWRLNLAYLALRLVSKVPTDIILRHLRRCLPTRRTYRFFCLASASFFFCFHGHFAMTCVCFQRRLLSVMWKHCHLVAWCRHFASRNTGIHCKLPFLLLFLFLFLFGAFPPTTGSSGKYFRHICTSKRVCANNNNKSKYIW